MVINWKDGELAPQWLARVLASLEGVEHGRIAPIRMYANAAIRLFAESDEKAKCGNTLWASGRLSCKAADNVRIVAAMLEEI